MSEQLLEREVPLEGHPKSTLIKECVRRCVRAENANPALSEWDEDAHLFLRVDHGALVQDLERFRVELSEPEKAYLYEFADRYADAREDESTRIEGEIDV